MWFWQAIQIIGSTILAMLKALLSLLPVFDEINSIPDQLMAAALGIPVIVLSVIGTIITIGKIVWRHVKDVWSNYTFR